MRKILIIGASGHACVCMEIFELNGKKVFGFYDDDNNLIGSKLYGHLVLGRISEGIDKIKNNTELDIFIGIGSNKDRKKIVEMIPDIDKKLFLNAIHPSAIMSPQITVGRGNFFGTGIIINIGAQIGNFVIINTNATVGHDVKLADYTQVSPGCNLTGHVVVEEGAYLGANSVVIPGKRIGAHAVVGAGSVVIHDIPAFCTAVGNPAKIIKKIHESNRS